MLSGLRCILLYVSWSAIMRSLFTLSLLTILLHASLAQGQAKKPQVSNGKTDSAQSEQRNANNALTPPPMQAQSNTTPSHQGTDSTRSHQDDKTSDGRIVKFTGALAVLAFLQFGAMAAQYCAMRKQAKYMRHGLKISIAATKAAGRSAIAARDAASAADRNAQTALSSLSAYREAERAWLIDDIRFPDHIPRQSESNFGGILMVAFVAKNIGKNPVFIRIVQSRFHAANELPDHPQYRNHLTTIFNSRLLAPDEPLIWECPFEEGSLADDQINRINGLSQSPLSLWAYARIEYESMGIRGVTQFCYRWHNTMGFSYVGDKQEFRKDGPDEYNEQT